MTLVKLALVLLIWCLPTQETIGSEDGDLIIPNRAEDVSPISVGDSLPRLTILDADSSQFDLNAACTIRPTILLFYRGGWCPYCIRHLSELQAIESELIDLGFQIISISPDRPEIVKRHVAEKGFKYQLLSDSEMSAALSLGIAFRLEDSLVKKYKDSYKIDVEGDSGQTHHLLPVPSLFIVGTDGVVMFSHVDANYKVRISSEELLELAKGFAQPSIK